MEKEGDEDVRTSYLTSMDIWFVAMKTFSVLSLIESLIVLALIKRGRGVVSRGDHFLFLGIIAIIRSHKERQLQRVSSEYLRDYLLEEIATIRDLYHRLVT